MELLTTLIGSSFSSGTVRGLAFIATSYSNSPILAVPEGSTMFCSPRVLTTSIGARPFDCSSRGSRSTITCRCLPPYGYGIDAPGTVTSWVRRKLSPTSFSSASDIPDSASWRIGTVDAL